MKETLISTNNEQNQKPPETSERNVILDAEINELKEKIEAINEDKLNPEQKQTFKKIKDKVFGITKKIIRTVELVTVITGVLAVANYKRTHSELEVTKDESVDRTISNDAYIYKHKDERTTHLLNILAGREKFTEEDMRNETNGFIKKIFEEKGIKNEIDIDSMSIEEINLIFNNLSKSDTTIHIDEFKNFFYDQLNMINDTNLIYKDVKINNNIYELVWQMEQECGNPEIRFTSENINFTPFSDFTGNQHYDPINNIVYVSAWDLTPEADWAPFFSEMAHAKQFNDNQIGAAINVLSDFAGIAARGKFNVNKITEEYYQLYEKNGSIEHQAHKIIKPYLKRKYKLFTQKKI